MTCLLMTVQELRRLSRAGEAGQEVPRTLPGSLDNINNWILPTALAEILAYKPDFRTTLLTLFEEKYLNPDSVSKVVHAYDKTFRLNYETVELRPDECSDLHLCQDYVDGSCNNDLCLLGHVCTTDHNSRILQNYFVSTLPSEILLMLIRGTSPCPQPLGPLDVCRNYNDFRGCGRRDCDALHICLSFVQGNAKCPYPSCTLIHDLTQPSVQKLLMKHGLPTNEAPIDIVKALVCNNTTLRQPRQVVLLPQVPVPPHTSTTVWSHHLYGDVDIPEICRVSVVGMCPNEGIGCPRLHSTEYTQWQVSEQGNSWMNLRARQSQRLEQVFCDPAQRSVCLRPLP
ncbi:Zinc finger CCCH-type antiviral protein 1-like [Homarus americanus]|uniref:Zinc finger CCCH-type antiviral protein 1-like n=1 Tax=Homarus americanus TaxID=6706 RepID=A0A8J5MWB0_HOMAM|nr:Zinc finger CCCH-type antiviral protein 1-like [Homarus americanus]